MSTDRFSSKEEVKYDRVIYGKGFRARMKNRPQSACPYAAGWFKQSWIAGWSDADMGILSDESQASTGEQK